MNLPIFRTRPLRMISGFAALIVGCASTVGCQEKGADRVAVSGRVSLDGSPLPTGTITFHHADKGAAASGEITDGAFSIPAASGPSPGECKVEIFSFKKTGRKIPGIAADGSGKTDEMVQVVPTQFNSSSTLKQTLNANGEKACVFDLKSR